MPSCAGCASTSNPTASKPKELMRSGPLQEGEPVLLIDRKDRRYLLVLRAGAVADLRGGKLLHDDLISTSEGRPVRTTRGETFLMVRATLAEFVLEMPRGAQIIYPKDLSAILLGADIYPGAAVLEAGTGSGALTMTLLRLGGILLSYVPTVPQAVRTVELLRQSGAFAMIETFETLVRPWNIEGASVRPAHRMVAHTAFITTARRVEQRTGEQRTVN